MHGHVRQLPPPRPRETRGTVRHTSTQSGTTAGAPIAPAAVAHVAARSPHTRSSPASRMHRRERFRAQRSRPVTAPTPQTTTTADPHSKTRHGTHAHKLRALEAAEGPGPLEACTPRHHPGRGSNSPVFFFHAGLTHIGMLARAARGDGQGTPRGVRKRRHMVLAAAPIAQVAGATECPRRASAGAHMAASRSPFLMESASP